MTNIITFSKYYSRGDVLSSSQASTIFSSNTKGIAEVPEEDKPDKGYKRGKIVVYYLGGQGVNIVNANSNKAHSENIKKKGSQTNSLFKAEGRSATTDRMVLPT